MFALNVMKWSYEGAQAAHVNGFNIGDDVCEAFGASPLLQRALQEEFDAVQPCW